MYIIAEEFMKKCGINKKIRTLSHSDCGDPYGNRTHVTAVKGRCLNRLTNGPKLRRR